MTFVLFQERDFSTGASCWTIRVFPTMRVENTEPHSGPVPEMQHTLCGYAGYTTLHRGQYGGRHTDWTDRGMPPEATAAEATREHQPQGNTCSALSAALRENPQ